MTTPAPDELSRAGLRLRFSRELDGPATAQLATITLSRPASLNAQTPSMWDGLAAIAVSLPPTVRVVVIQGEGRAFSAGLDRAMFTPEGVGRLGAGSAADADRQIAAWQRAFDWRSAASIVSIAAVHGHAIGAGLQLALGCDLRVLADDAQLAMAETSLGLVPDLGGTKRLVELVGYSRASDLCLTGRRVDAAEASAIGLASRVVAATAIEDAVRELVEELLRVDRGAATETKALLAAAGGRTQSEQEQAERQAQYRRLRALLGLSAD